MFNSSQWGFKKLNGTEKLEENYFGLELKFHRRVSVKLVNLPEERDRTWLWCLIM